MHLSIFLTTHVMSIETTMHIMAYNGSQVKIDDICQKWQEMDFRVFLVVVIEVTRKTMAKMVENGRKWVAVVIW